MRIHFIGPPSGLVEQAFPPRVINSKADAREEMDNEGVFADI
jgi:hypothetical protein